MSKQLQQNIAVLPEQPGVYLMRDADGRVIYVGKAINLKNRVRYYFRNLSAHSPKVRAMVEQIADFETILCQSEAEALILECNMIKKFRPRYNISLKDDKSYPYIKVTVQEEFPRVFTSRTLLKDGATYFGPYADVGAMHSMLKLLKKLFPLRTCSKMGNRPCLNYHIKRCLGPCAGFIGKRDYKQMVECVCMVLAGRTKDLEQDLQKKMEQASEQLNYEDAIRFRDLLNSLASLNEGHKAVTGRVKKLMKDRLKLENLHLKDDLAAAEELQLALGLKEPLERMDCFDISHTQGSETVASMVVFRNGTAAKKDYRKYKIKSAEGKPDDFKSMQEVVYRRYHDYEDLPDLVVIDGGKGQLSSALEIIRGLGLKELPVVGLAEKNEEIFVEGKSESIVLPRESGALHLIQRIRNEAHRFAITFHRKLRAKRNLVSVLDHVDGIGPKRRTELWKRYKTLEAMHAASIDDLASTTGMNRLAAESLYGFFHKV
ncbi:MAG: excinuclease ABC subunit C [Phascolarctobacterium sp.]|nr:excinuclease ABC subunit C [Candidatus Phascolarctobacterium caballi]